MPRNQSGMTDSKIFFKAIIIDTTRVVLNEVNTDSCIVQAAGMENRKQ